MTRNTTTEFEGWPSLLARLLAGRDLTAAQAEAATTEILTGAATASQMSAFLVALRAKGETSEELGAMLRAVRSAGTKVALGASLAARAIDIVGTGGDKSNSVNVSTMAALVTAGAGVPVCKHGNRAASSKCGSADLLEAAGLAIELDAEGVEATIASSGFGFCLAPRFHPAFRHAGPSRREIGVPTAFNLLGPMANPAPITRMLVGVAMPEKMDTMAAALGSRGIETAWVVHGHGGLDELAVSGPNRVCELRGGVVSRFEIDARTHGIAPSRPGDVLGGSPEDNLVALRSLVDGARGPVRDIVVFNAGCALHIAGLASGIGEGIERAAASIDSGAAAGVLAAAVAESRRQAERMGQ